MNNDLAGDIRNLIERAERGDAIVHTLSLEVSFTTKTGTLIKFAIEPLTEELFYKHRQAICDDMFSFPKFVDKYPAFGYVFFRNDRVENVGSAWQIMQQFLSEITCICCRPDQSIRRLA